MATTSSGSPTHRGPKSVFCYAYYVRPPPTSGTIVIRKEVRSDQPATHDFSFDGNLSFNQGGLFNLRVNNGRAASQTFYRAATGPSDDPWTVRELVPAGWSLADLSCASPGSSTAAIDLAAGRADITLAAGDRVVCTYVNEVEPPAGELFLRKLTGMASAASTSGSGPLLGETRLTQRPPPSTRAWGWTHSRAR